MECLQTFQDYKRKQMAEQGIEWDHNDYVFGKANGKMPAPGTLGHAPPVTTTTIYAHALQCASAKTANVMQNLFGGKKFLATHS